MFEYAKCNLCRSDDYVVLYPCSITDEPLRPEEITVAYDRKEYCRIVRCKKCGLVYANPRDSLEGLRDAYRRLGEEEYLEESESRSITFSKDLHFIERYCKGGNLLDVGCSVGLFLRLAKENHWNTYGVEISEINSRYARDILGLDVTTGTIHDANYGDDFFDVITLWDVIEHVPDPMSVLMKLNRIQKPGGYLFLSTPDVGSFLSRILGSRWMWLIRTHIFYFSRKTIRQMLEKAGYQVVYISSYSRIFRFEYIVDRIKPHSARLHSVMSFLMDLFRVGGFRLRVNFLDFMAVVAQKI